MNSSLAALVSDRSVWADPFGTRLRLDVPAGQVTTFGVGAGVPLIIEPISAPGLARAIDRIKPSHGSFRVLGAGSNTVLPDAPLEEPVIRLGRDLGAVIPGARLEEPSLGSLEALRLQGSSSDDVVAGDRLTVVAFAGAPLMSLSRRLSAAGFTGLEFAAGIPAHIGGAVRMNAGAHGHSLSEVVRRVAVVTDGDRIRLLDPAELAFTYRSSSVPAGAVVLAAELELTRGDPESIARVRSDCLAYRKATQPLHLPSAGSVFRNPSQGELPPSIIAAGGGAAGWLLERSEMKGRASGGIEYSTQHANWLVRRSGSDARASDVRTLIEEGAERVHERFGVRLKPEIFLW